MEESKKQNLSGCGDMETQAWAQHTRQPTRETTERETLRCDAGGNFRRRQRGPAPYTRRSAMHRQVGHRRCVCRGRTHVDQLRFVGIGMRWCTVFVVRLFCHGPYLQALLWRDVPGEEFVAGVECRVTASRNSSSLPNQSSTPSFCQVSSNERSRTERERVALACAWMQLLKLRKTVRSQGCKCGVLRGG